MSYAAIWLYMASFCQGAKRKKQHPPELNAKTIINMGRSYCIRENNMLYSQ